MFRKLLMAAGGILIMLGVTTVLAADPAPFNESFNGSPVSPVAFNSENWDIQVHSRDPGTWYSLEGINAQHGADCSVPPATHYNTSYEGSVFQCRDHVMTAINADGYGVIYLTPNRVLDFSTGGVVKFDMSTLRMSTRDWVDIWITPYEDNLALPFDNGDVDLQGIPRRGIHINMSAFNGGTTFRCSRIDNFVQSEDLDRNGSDDSYWWETIEGWLQLNGRQPSATVRDTFQIDITPNHLRFSSPTIPDGQGNVYSGCDNALANLGFTKGIVQIGHHSYTPTKDGAGVPATWHWDNISIEPSTPFSIIQADRRYVDSEQTVAFSFPAPAESNLRFSANGIVEVNFGNGWQAARVQPAEKNVDRTKSYWMPVPEGTQYVQFRGQDTFNGPFFAKDFSIWSLSTQASPTPTATSTSSTPTTTSTVVVTATSTPVPPTPTPTIANTATPTATSTPLPPTPVLFECRTRDQRQTRPVGSTSWQTANDPWSTVTIVASRAECVGD